MEEVGLQALDAGTQLIGNGRLVTGANFFRILVPIFPRIMTVYALLYGQIQSMRKQYILAANQAVKSEENKKCLLISISVWGDSYVELFTRYFLPSILAPNNIPAVAIRRNIHFDIYTTKTDKHKIQSTPSFRSIAKLCKINFIEFPDELISNPEYKRPHSNVRYLIYGGFHHLSMARARLLYADIICIAPDGVHADGSYRNYVNFIDEGYKAVVFTATRGQAETLRPELDKFISPKTHALVVPPRDLVYLALRNIHHDFQQYVVTKTNTKFPEISPILLFPEKHGIFAHCFHIHPIIISADTLIKEVKWDYATVDANLMSALFPSASDWKDIKVIDDTDDGVMLDLTYAIKNPTNYPENNFSIHSITTHLGAQMSYFQKHHLWCFTHQIKYHTDEELNALRTFNLDTNDNLVPREICISSNFNQVSEDLASWMANAPNKYLFE